MRWMKSTVTKPCLIKLLLLLLFVQSITAQADTHQFHQSGSTHLEFNHHHAEDVDLAHPHLHDVQSAAFDSDNELDCHHCCHCHRVSSVALLPLLDAIHIQKVNSSLPAYRASCASVVVSFILRPPISRS